MSLGIFTMVFPVVSCVALGTPGVTPRCPEVPPEVFSKLSHLEFTQGEEGVLSDLLGGTEEFARNCVEKIGLDWRVIDRDGVSLPGTKDYRANRVNVVLENGIVRHLYLG